MRFLHTADWQLGMTRHFLDDDAQPRYTAARMDVIERIGEIAHENECEFIVVCGDVFDSNFLPQRVVQRSLEKMRALNLPIYLLPGNHDPLDAASVYRSDAFLSHQPDNVYVLEDSAPVPVTAEIELIPAPWRSKDPRADLLAAAIDAAGEASSVRIAVGHGIVDVLNPDRHNLASVSLSALERALDEQQIHYVALGDRHSVTAVGDSGAVWYPSAPEVTDYDDIEVDSGKVLVVDVDKNSLQVTPHAVGRWRFLTIAADVNDRADIHDLLERLRSLEHKDVTVIRLGLKGTLSLAENAELEHGLNLLRETFAALFFWHRRTDIATYVDGDELTNLGVGGYIFAAASELADHAGATDAETEEKEDAQHALQLLYRLAGGSR